MLDSKILRDILKQIYQIDDKYLVPLSQGWFVPTLPEEETVGTWIGYRVLAIEPYTRGYTTSEDFVTIPVKMTFRISFVGPQAEDFAYQTMLWDLRTDIQELFDKQEAQINYEAREIFTYPLKNKGFNDMLCWVVDFHAQTFYKVNANHIPWIPFT